MKKFLKIIYFIGLSIYYGYFISLLSYNYKYGLLCFKHRKFKLIAYITYDDNYITGKVIGFSDIKIAKRESFLIDIVRIIGALKFQQELMDVLESSSTENFR